MAALTAMGNAAPQLKVHINGALNVGCSVEEIVEVIIQMSAYSGFPSSINGINILKDVLNDREINFKPVKNEENKDRLTMGVKWLFKLDKNQV